MTPARTLTLVLICARAFAHSDTSDAKDTLKKKPHKIFSDDDVYNWPDDQIYRTSDDVQVYNVSANVNVIRNAFSESLLSDMLQDDVLDLTDEEYYAMPPLFELDEYTSCLALQGTYCLGSFHLSPSRNEELFRTLQRFSSDWIANYNHTRLHRGVCLTRSCIPRHSSFHSSEAWFESCVNNTTLSKYNLTAKLFHLDYCYEGKEPTPPLNLSEKAFVGLVILLLIFATISTSLDLLLTDCNKKDYGWALSWSLKSSWRSLVTPAPSSSGIDIRFFDGLRVFCMMSVIVEHVCWLAAQAYLKDTRFLELSRRSIDGVLLFNSTLIVQVFFLMATFLLAHKMLQEKTGSSVKTFFKMMMNRLIRISPSYFIVVWFASSCWERIGSGAQWATLVKSETAVCRQKWWLQLLYLANVVNTDEKCLIQTWSLATDMQLYALALVLMLVLRTRRVAIPILGSLFFGTTVMNLVLAYYLRLMPTFVIHNPETVRVTYKNDQSFDWLYTSPQSNAAGALAGLLLAHLHHAIQENGSAQRLAANNLFRWASILSAPVAAVFVGATPHFLGISVPGRFPAAVLAAIERPIFISLVAFACLGAIIGVDSPWRRWMSSGTTLARLSFGVLLLHMLIFKTYLATRPSPIYMDRLSIYLEWFGLSIISYVAAIPLALLVELPAQRLYKELTSMRKKTSQQKIKQNPEQKSNEILYDKCKMS